MNSVLELPVYRLHDILAAIRGPDLEFLDAHKWIFTARIRYLVYDTTMIGCLTRETPEISESDLQALPDEVKQLGRDVDKVTAYCHYMAHVRGALTVLADVLPSDYWDELAVLKNLAVSLTHTASEYKYELRHFKCTSFSIVERVQEIVKNYIEDFEKAGLLKEVGCD